MLLFSSLKWFKKNKYTTTVVWKNRQCTSRSWPWLKIQFYKTGSVSAYMYMGLEKAREKEPAPVTPFRLLFSTWLRRHRHDRLKAARSPVTAAPLRQPRAHPPPGTQTSIQPLSLPEVLSSGNHAQGKSSTYT